MIKNGKWKPTIWCCLCGKEKPIEDGCFIAISHHKDRCKECQDKMQEDCRNRKAIEELNNSKEHKKLVNEMIKIANEMLNE